MRMVLGYQQLLSDEGAVLAGSMAGYALARFDYRLLRLRSEGIALLFIAQRMFSPFILILPLLIRGGWGFWPSIVISCLVTLGLYAVMFGLSARVGLRL